VPGQLVDHGRERITLVHLHGEDELEADLDGLALLGADGGDRPE
jgi:hypothetical protein